MILKHIIDYLKSDWLNLLYQALLAAGVFLVIYFIIKWIVRKVRNRIESDDSQSMEYKQKLSKLVGNIIFVILMIFDVLAVFQVIWFDVAIIMWGISLSLWFAMESVIWNVISWMLLLMNKKVKIWDYVDFLWSLKISWTIEEVNLRYTIVRTFDKRRVIVPNSEIAKTPIKTLKTENLIRGDLKINLPRNVDLDQMKKLIIQTINGVEGVLHPEYSNVIVKWFDSLGINLIWYFFVNPNKKKNKAVVLKELRVKLLDLFKKYGIPTPYENCVINFQN